MNRTILGYLLISGLAVTVGFAGVSSPYTPDADTLHLWHFDGQTGGMTPDAAASGRIDLFLDYGASVTSASVFGFGTALNTYEGAAGDAPFAGSHAAVADFVGADGAFTFEALIRPDVALSALPNHMEIISAESDDNSGRAWQFRIKNTGELEFNNIMAAGNDFLAAIPTGSDPHAWEVGAWVHVAVTYTGNPAASDNLKLYWTRLDSNASEARLLASFRMTADIDPARNVLFCVGNELRSYGGYSENFEGLIDEVRISSIARAANDMLIVPDLPSPVIVSDPTDTAVRETQAASFTTVFTSASAPTVTWYRVVSPADMAMDPSQVQTVYDAGSEQYTSVLTIADLTLSDAGEYYCRIVNDSGLPRNSAVAGLVVHGLVAHWTLDQNRWADGRYLEEIGSYDAIVTGTPIFVAGADGIANHAVQISASAGWAMCPLLDPVRQSGQMSVSFWADWDETQGTHQDLRAQSTQEEVLTMANGLKADGGWQHVCLVCDGTTGKLYVDGVLQSQGPWRLPDETLAAMNIGVGPDLQNPFNGALDDVRVFNYAMTDFEVADLRYALSGERSCILEFDAQYDLSGPAGEADCVVDLHDLAAFAGQWLSVYGMEDFADFSTSWQTGGFYPSGI